jgi:hypothetical protein
MAWYCVMVELLTGTCPPEVENPREKPWEDFVELAASCVSPCHLRTTSRAIGRRWYEETRAAEETDGFLSTIAVFMTRSILCTVEAWFCQYILPPIENVATHINDSAERADCIWSVNRICSTTCILHYCTCDHNNILCRMRQFLNDKVDHLS